MRFLAIWWERVRGQHLSPTLMALVGVGLTLGGVALRAPVSHYWG